VEFELRHRFPVSAARAYAELFSEPFEVESAARSRIDRQVLEDRTEGGRRVRRVRVRPEQTFPAPVAKVIGQDRFNYVMEETHDISNTRMDWVVVPDAMADKLTVKGSWGLVGSGDTCERIVRIEIRVRIPLIGGKIEQQIGAELKAGYEQAAVFAQQWLQEHA